MTNSKICDVYNDSASGQWTRLHLSATQNYLFVCCFFFPFYLVESCMESKPGHPTWCKIKISILPIAKKKKKPAHRIKSLRVLPTVKKRRPNIVGLSDSNKIWSIDPMQNSHECHTFYKLFRLFTVGFKNGQLDFSFASLWLQITVTWSYIDVHNFPNVTSQCYSGKDKKYTWNLEAIMKCIDSK